MKTTKDILEEYQNADMMRRLHLYLQFPDQRDAFLAEGLKDAKYSGEKPFKCCRTLEWGEKSRQPNRWRRFFIHGFACR